MQNSFEIGSWKKFDIDFASFLGEPSNISDDMILDGSMPGQWCSLACRSVRVGSYKVLPKDKINVTKSGVQIKVPAILNTDEIITINIQMTDVLKVSIGILK